MMQSFRCSSGYARSRFVSGRACLPCSADNKAPVLQTSNYPQPICDCKPGYDGFILTAADTCTACKPGQTSDASRKSPTNPGYYDNSCRCKDLNAVFMFDNCNTCKAGYVRNPRTSQCEMSAACKTSKWVGRFWDRSKIGAWNGTFFPSFLIDNKVPPTKTVTYSSLDLAFNSPASIPVAPPFAAVFDVVLWGKKASPPWTGLSRYGSSSRMIAKWSGSRFTGGAFAFNPSVGVAEPFVVDVGRVVGYGDECMVMRLAWWGVKGKPTLTARIVRHLGGLGTWYT